MAPTYRIFEAEATRSVATAVTLKDGSLLQVKPAKQTFPTLEAWQAAVGMEGRTLSTNASHAELPADNKRVAAAIERARAAFKGVHFQPQYLRHSSVTVAARMVELKKQIRWVTEFKRMNHLSAFKEGPLAGLGAFYHHMLIYNNTFATLEAFYNYYKQMAQSWLKPDESSNLAAWVEKQPAGQSLKEAQGALEALVPESEISKDARQTDDQRQLEELEARVRADPAAANETTVVYTLMPKRVPSLFVMAGAGFLPVYYSAEYEMIGIRGINGKIYRSFAAVGITEEPVFYVMHPELHLMKPLAAT